MANSQTELSSAYLVCGTDELKRQRVIARLHKRVATLGDLSFNFDEFNGETATAEDIVAACNTIPFASPIRLVQVNNVDKIKAAGQVPLLDYLSAPNESTVLCLVASGLAKNTKLYKAVAALGPKTIIDCAPIKRKDLPSTVRAMAVTHGITLTESAAHALIDLVGDGTVALDSELQKIALAHRGTDPVNDNEVSSLVSRTAEVKPWEFVDAFAARNAKKCLLLIGRMDSVSPHALMSMCTTRVRELITARALMQRGQLPALGRTLKMPDWRVKNHVNWARRFTDAELRHALLTARDTERAMKSGADPDESFRIWFLQAIESHTPRR